MDPVLAHVLRSVGMHVTGGVIAAGCLLVGCGQSAPATARQAVPNDVAAPPAPGSGEVAAREEPLWPASTVAVIGDSYSAGSDNEVIWPQVLAERFGWQLENASLGGAGYLAGVDYLGTFADQIQVLGGTDPDVILIVGTANDVESDACDVAGSARDIYAELDSEFPRSRVVVIGPIWDASEPPPNLWDVDGAVHDASVTAGLPFYDALPHDWLGDPSIIQADGVHPTDEGQLGLADDIDEALHSLPAGRTG